MATCGIYHLDRQASCSLSVHPHFPCTWTLRKIHTQIRTDIQTQTHRYTEADTQMHRHRHSDTQTQTNKHTNTHIHTTATHRQRQIHICRQTCTETETYTDRPTNTHIDKQQADRQSDKTGRHTDTQTRDALVHIHG